MYLRILNLNVIINKIAIINKQAIIRKTNKDRV